MTWKTLNLKALSDISNARSTPIILEMILKFEITFLYFKNNFSESRVSSDIVVEKLTRIQQSDAIYNDLFNDLINPIARPIKIVKKNSLNPFNNKLKSG